MKKLLVLLFALGLVFSFSAPVMATDVSVEGTYRIRGWSDTNAPLVEESVTSSYYDQRLRVGVTFQVAEGLKLFTRADILDTIWGRADISRSDLTTSQDNIQFDLCYVTFMTAIGQFRAGIMSDGTWGLPFGNLETFDAKIDWTAKVGNWILNAHFLKHGEGDQGHILSDRDYDSYRIATIYMDKALTAGIVWVYAIDARDPLGMGSALGLKATVHIVAPYFKANLGDLYIEGEAGWAGGEVDMEPLGMDNIDLEGLRAYLMAKYTLGPAYVGGFAAYVQGDDPETPTERENFLSSGGDWDPCLILFNDTCPTSLGHVAGATTGTAMTNGWLYQVFAGASPMDKLSVKASLSYAVTDEKPKGFVDNVYGTEIDLEGAYKLYDNLTYSVGFGYLSAGDYYKGTDKNNKIENTYLVMNKLEVSF